MAFVVRSMAGWSPWDLLDHEAEEMARDLVANAVEGVIFTAT